MINKKRIMAFSFMFAACTAPNELLEDADDLENYSLPTTPHQIEICHNPESTQHGALCSDECFIPNLQEFSFCWTLEASDCSLPLEYQWQTDNCHFFDKEN